MMDGPGVFRSTDDGRSWQSVRLPVVGRVDGVAIGKDGSAFLTLIPPRVLASFDGGARWQPVATDASAFLVQDEDGNVAVGAPTDRATTRIARVLYGEPPSVERIGVVETLEGSADSPSVPQPPSEPSPPSRTRWKCEPIGPSVDATRIRSIDPELMDLPNGASFAAIESDAEGIALRFGDLAATPFIRSERVSLMPNDYPASMVVRRSEHAILVAREPSNPKGPRSVELAWYTFADGVVHHASIPVDGGNSVYPVEIAAPTADGFTLIVGDLGARCLRWISMAGNVGDCRSFDPGVSAIHSAMGPDSVLVLTKTRSAIEVMSADPSALRPVRISPPFHVWGSVYEGPLELIEASGRRGVLTTPEGGRMWFLPIVDGVIARDAIEEWPMPPARLSLPGDLPISSAHVRIRPRQAVTIDDQSDERFEDALARVSPAGETFTVGYGSAYRRDFRPDEPPNAKRRALMLANGPQGVRALVLRVAADAKMSLESAQCVEVAHD